MRTDNEILDRIKYLDSDNSLDFLNFQRALLVSSLPFDKAKRFLKPEATADKWSHQKNDHDAIKAEILEYMPFAWEKANDCRGNSAYRSLEYMKCWFWFLGHDIEDALSNYTHYGKPQLRAICEHLNIDWRKYDSGEWVNFEDDTPVCADDVACIDLKI